MKYKGLARLHSRSEKIVEKLKELGYTYRAEDICKKDFDVISINCGYVELLKLGEFVPNPAITDCGINETLFMSIATQTDEIKLSFPTITDAVMVGDDLLVFHLGNGKTKAPNVAVHKFNVGDKVYMMYANKVAEFVIESFRIINDCVDYKINEFGSNIPENMLFETKEELLKSL